MHRQAVLGVSQVQQRQWMMTERKCDVSGEGCGGAVECVAWKCAIFLGHCTASNEVALKNAGWGKG